MLQKQRWVGELDDRVRPGQIPLLGERQASLQPHKQRACKRCSSLQQFDTVEAFVIPG